jgi:DNA recombination protein RmuC
MVIFVLATVNALLALVALAALAAAVGAGRRRDGQERTAQALRRELHDDARDLRGEVGDRLAGLEDTLGRRLEQLFRGLGEVQALATGVGDLKKLLGNVRARGTWGEIQLGALLAQALAPAQIAANVAVRRGSDERVEYAVKLPGRDAGDEPVLLPIDSKFPLEDYHRLLDALEAGDAPAAARAHAQLEARVVKCARDVQGKYLCPPRTTDFAILFLPTESLYAEVLRRPGLVERLHADHRVVVAGPTTLLALLGSLQLGFRTLAVERRSAEAWRLLASARGDLARLVEGLDKASKKLDEAEAAVTDAAARGRLLARRLREVEELPASAAAAPQSPEPVPTFPSTP